MFMVQVCLRAFPSKAAKGRVIFSALKLMNETKFFNIIILSDVLDAINTTNDYTMWKKMKH